MKKFVVLTFLWQLCSVSSSWVDCSVDATLTTSCFLLILFLQSSSPLFFSSATLKRDALMSIKVLQDKNPSRVKNQVSYYSGSDSTLWTEQKWGYEEESAKPQRISLSALCWLRKKQSDAKNEAASPLSTVCLHCKPKHCEKGQSRTCAWICQALQIYVSALGVNLDWYRPLVFRLVRVWALTVQYTGMFCRFYRKLVLFFSHHLPLLDGHLFGRHAVRQPVSRPCGRKQIPRMDTVPAEVLNVVQRQRLRLDQGLRERLRFGWWLRSH